MMSKNRPKKPDYEKIKAIISILLQNPEGIWLRKLSRDTKIPLSTIHYYIERILDNLVDNVGARDEHGHFFGIRLIRLKSGVASQLRDGVNLRKIIKTNEILKNFD